MVKCGELGLARNLGHLILFALLGLSPLIAIQVAVNRVATIRGVTLLTSLYGFFVEGREF